MHRRLPGSRRLLVGVSAIAMIATAVAATALVTVQGVHATPQKQDPGAPTLIVDNAIHSDVSPPLRNMTAAPTSPDGKKEKEHKGLPIGDAGKKRSDPVIQTAPAGPLAPTPGLNFAGVGNGDYGFTPNSAPPDTNGAVGATQYVQWVNESFAVFNKSTGAIAAGFPKAGNTLWSGFGGGCQTNNDGDPIVQYDKAANRWVLTQFSVSTTPFLQCVAVSTTSDATGSYNRYSFSYSNFNDYPKMGVWPDGYYISYNMFNGNTFVGARACAFDRAKMLTGAAATQVCFQLSSSFGGLLPSDLDGSNAPPAGSPNYFLNFGTNSLNMWKFHVDFTTPANSTLTGPTNIPVAAFSAACSGGGTCIPQPSTTNQLESLADRLMYRLAYRKFSDGHESLVVNHSVTAGSSVGVRWYELRSPGGTPTVFQQGTYAPDSSYRWMGSIAMDQAGNIAMGYSVSSSTVRPGIRYTGRLAGDTLGQMTQGETTLQAGVGSQTGSLHRWGDYSAITVDPVDDCTFWYTNEYLKATGSFNWSTRIGSFKLPNCGGAPPANDFSISANPSSLTMAQGGNGNSTISTALVSGSAETISLTVSGAPTGASASLNPTSVTTGGSSTLTVNAGTAAAGTYTLNVTGTAPSATHSVPVSLTITSSGGGGITNGGFETGDFTGWTRAGSTAISSTAHSGTKSAMVGSASPFNGDSSIAQTFTAPTGVTTLSFWYRNVCTDTVTFDWATATLKDNTTGVTTTVLAKTCTNNGTFVQKTASVTAGHSYTLTLIDHDDNFAGDPTYTLYDDVALS
jgi:hypothetical protein